MSWDFGIRKIEGLSQEQFFDKLVKEGIIQWVSSNWTVVDLENPDLTPSVSEDELLNPMVSSAWLLDHLQCVFQLVAFNYSNSTTKEALKIELTKKEWICQSVRIAIAHAREKDTNLYYMLLLKIEQLHKWFELVSKYERSRDIDSEIIEIISHEDALFYTDYLSEIHRMHKVVNKECKAFYKRAEELQEK